MKKESREIFCIARERPKNLYRRGFRSFRRSVLFPGCPSGADSPFWGAAVPGQVFPGIPKKRKRQKKGGPLAGLSL